MLLGARRSTRRVTPANVWQRVFTKPALRLLLAIGLGGLLAAGCRTTDKSAAGGFAWVVIHGNTPGQINDVAREVFREHGYQSAPTRSDDLVFEIKGSRLDEVAYGSWMGETPVWLRVKTAIVPVGEAVFRLECKAYRVEDKGASTEEETKLWRRHPYQKLLDQVALRLQGKAAPPP
jgi:hypothetical protein